MGYTPRPERIGNYKKTEDDKKALAKAQAKRDRKAASRKEKSK